MEYQTTRLYLDEEEAEHVDARRGDLTRSKWVRGLIRRDMVPTGPTIDEVVEEAIAAAAVAYRAGDVGRGAALVIRAAMISETYDDLQDLTRD